MRGRRSWVTSVAATRLDMRSARVRRVGLRRLIVGLVIAGILATSFGGMPAAGEAKLPSYQNLKFSKALSWQGPTSWKTCPTPRFPKVNQTQLELLRKRPGKGNRITVVGDSLIHDSYWALGQALLDRGWLPTIVCWGGKTTPWALQQLKRLKASNRLATRVVVATGTNDMLFKTKPKRFRKQAVATSRWLAANTQQYWWVNTSFVLGRVTIARFKPRLSQYPEFNKIISSSIASTKPAGRLLNWHKLVSRRSQKYIGSDGIHDTRTGRKLRVKLISRVLPVVAN